MTTMNDTQIRKHETTEEFSVNDPVVFCRQFLFKHEDPEHYQVRPRCRAVVIEVQRENFGEKRVRSYVLGNRRGDIWTFEVNGGDKVLMSDKRFAEEKKLQEERKEAFARMRANAVKAFDSAWSAASA